MTPKTPCLSPYQHPMGSSADLCSRRLEKGQFAGHAAIRGQNPNNEPVTLHSSLPTAVALSPPYCLR
ncbi:MAG: hypothetical protein GX456_18110 [Verrucomicrobia bacterium]|nr:hypothetical protein [Verrucomicrobiota bacterium]